MSLLSLLCVFPHFSLPYQISVYVHCTLTLLLVSCQHVCISTLTPLYLPFVYPHFSAFLHSDYFGFGFHKFTSFEVLRTLQLPFVIFCFPSASLTSTNTFYRTENCVCWSCLRRRCRVFASLISETAWQFLDYEHPVKRSSAVTQNNTVCVLLPLLRRDYPVITIWHGRSQQQSPWPNWVILHSVWPDGFLLVPTTGMGQKAVWEWEGEVGISGPHLLFHSTDCGRVIVATNCSGCQYRLMLARQVWDTDGQSTRTAYVEQMSITMILIFISKQRSPSRGTFKK